MFYQRGSLKKVRRREGEVWVLRYRVTNSDGRRFENVMPIGLIVGGIGWTRIAVRLAPVQLRRLLPVLAAVGGFMIL
jgi:hypothetical protein